MLPSLHFPNCTPLLIFTPRRYVAKEMILPPMNDHTSVKTDVKSICSNAPLLNIFLQDSIAPLILWPGNNHGR